MSFLLFCFSAIPASASLLPKATPFRFNALGTNQAECESQLKDLVFELGQIDGVQVVSSSCVQQGRLKFYDGRVNFFAPAGTEAVSLGAKSEKFWSYSSLADCQQSLGEQSLIFSTETGLLPLSQRCIAYSPTQAQLELVAVGQPERKPYLLELTYGAERPTLQDWAFNQIQAADGHFIGTRAQTFFYYAKQPAAKQMSYGGGLFFPDESTCDRELNQVRQIFATLPLNVVDSWCNAKHELQWLDTELREPRMTQVPDSLYAGYSQCARDKERVLGIYQSLSGGQGVAGATCSEQGAGPQFFMTLWEKK
jgi:hypothetical protein